jgi:hypothetical protein
LDFNRKVTADSTKQTKKAAQLGVKGLIDLVDAATVYVHARQKLLDYAGADAASQFEAMWLKGSGSH